MNIIELKDVNFTYDGNKYVLSNINLEFESGKVYGVFGRSGAGKSTLLSLIAGLEELKEGKILYKDKNLTKMNKDNYRSHQIGIVFQSYNLLPHLTALENVILSIDISGKKITDKNKRALECLEKVGIDSEKANRRVLKLSGGEQQRVAIARALSYGAEVILADEPTGNLDKETEEEILDLFLKLAHEDNKCVIIISHSTKVRDSVDILYKLVKGKIEE